MKRLTLSLLVIFLASPIFALAQTAKDRYCPDNKIFNDSVAMEGNSPWIDVIIDPTWKQTELKDKRHIIDPIRLTPVYNLVVRIKPIFNSYCIDGREVEATDLPESLPIKGSILIGEGRSAVEIASGSFQPNKVKDPERGFVYEWKLKGWPDGIVSGEKMENLITAVAAGRTITTALDITKKDGIIEHLISSVSFDLCVPIWGQGKNKIVTMRGTMSGLSVGAGLQKADSDTRERGFESIEPLKTYRNHFAYFLDLQRYADDKLLLDKIEKSYNALRIGSSYKMVPAKSACGDNGKVYLLYVGSRFSAGRLENVEGLAAPGSPVVVLHDNMSPPHIVHEIAGHTIGGLMDEYEQGGATYYLDTSKNCSLEPEVNYMFGGKLYGERNMQGCSVRFLAKRPGKVGAEPTLARRVYRPSLVGLMNIELFNPAFNVVNCGHIIAGIIGGDGKSYFPECAKMDGVIKDGVQASALYPFFAALERILSSSSARTQTAAVGENVDPSAESGQYLIAESFDPNNPWGEIIEVVPDSQTITTPTLTTPPPTPPSSDFLANESIFDTISVDLKVNGKDGPVTVSPGSRIVVSWISEGATRCRANWSRNDVKLAGTAAGRLSRSITIRAACINAEGERVDDAVQVLVDTESS